MNEKQVTAKRVIEMITTEGSTFYPQIQAPSGEWMTLPNPKTGGDLIYDNIESANACLDAIPKSEYIIHEYVAKEPLQQV